MHFLPMKYLVGFFNILGVNRIKKNLKNLEKSCLYILKLIAYSIFFFSTKRIDP